MSKFLLTVGHRAVRRAGPIRRNWCARRRVRFANRRRLRRQNHSPTWQVHAHSCGAVHGYLPRQRSRWKWLHPLQRLRDKTARTMVIAASAASSAAHADRSAVKQNVRNGVARWRSSQDSSDEQMFGAL
jgi:hypothetical protein